MKIKTALILSVMLLIFMNCQKDSTGPDPDNLSGIQEDVFWPSLGDTPWPMFQHDPQGTGRSQFSGPQRGRIVKNMIINRGGGKINYTAIDPDDNILIALSHVWSDSLQETDGYVFKYNSAGDRLWYFNIGGHEIYHSPLIDANGVIYIGSDEDGVFYAINPDGTLKWKYETNSAITCGYTSPGIGMDGTIYFSDQTGLYAVDPQGQLKWKKDGYHNTGITISPDGNSLYVTHILYGIESLDLNGNSKWLYEIPDLVGVGTYPLVDSNGRIYYPYDDYTYIAINENGELLWSFDIRSAENYSGSDIDCTTAPTIDKVGNFYFYTGNDLYSIDYAGKLRWIILGLEGIAAHLISDKDGHIYSVTQFDGAFDVLSFNSEGKLNWKTFLYCPEYGFCYASISSQGKLILLTYDRTDYIKSKLYIIE